jgi:hypothetical protein
MTSRASREIAAAIRKFPDRVESIARLAGRDEAFRDMCEELAAAEEALARLESEATAAGTARRTECEGWITRLTAEMAAALGRAEIISLPTSRARRRPSGS